MERKLISLDDASLLLDGLEVLDDEMILIRGGLALRGGCSGGSGCGCGCSGGAGCGCGCGCCPTVAPE